MVKQLEEFTFEMDKDELRQFSSDYFIPLDVHPEVLDANACFADFPEGKIGLYTRLCDYANKRVPISLFLSNVLNFYHLHISQLHCICEPAFYHTTWSHGCVSFAKGAGRLQFCTDKVDSLRKSFYG
jgi:hypothetical protein